MATPTTARITTRSWLIILSIVIVFLSQLEPCQSQELEHDACDTDDPQHNANNNYQPLDNNDNNGEKMFGNAEISGRRLLWSPAGVFSKEEEPFYLIPKYLSPYEMTPLMARHNGRHICPYTRFMGLPSTFAQALQQFTHDSGLHDVFWDLTYEHATPRQENTDTDLLFQLHSLGKIRPGFPREWSTMIPIGNTGNWPLCDIHWIDAANEGSFEETLDVLRKADMDPILHAIGHEFGLNSLAVTGLGFMAISHCQDAVFHTDNPGAEHYFFQLLVPVELPTDNFNATLILGQRQDDQEDVLGPVRFHMDRAILISGDTFHASPNFDFRPHRGLRVMASIYISDLERPEIQEVVAGDGTYHHSWTHSLVRALFPPRYLVEWFRAQRGRHWDRNDNNISMTNDSGRYPLGDLVDDEWDECPRLALEGKCRTDLEETRRNCWKSCKLFIDDETYYRDWFPESTKGDEDSDNDNDKDDDNDNDEDDDNDNDEDDNDEENGLADEL